jgi:acetolactate synthase I/II/III large subunit
MRAADFIVRSLEAHGIKRIYCVPGESYLALLDAIHESRTIELIVCRHEGGAGFMAAAEAKLTGLPAVVLASRGPGATNASIAVHMAEQDALPVILMLGQVDRKERLRGVFQEIDYTQFFGSLAKGVFEIAEGRKVPELMPRAIHLAQEGVPGPVVLSLPEDMLNDAVEGDPAIVFPFARYGHRSTDVADIQALIDQSQRPVIVAGARVRTSAGKVSLRQFAEAQRIPVAVTWKNQDVFDNTSSLYAGHLGFGTPQNLRQLLAEADLIIAVGTRLGDVATLGYTFPSIPAPAQRLIHIYPDSKPLGRVFRTDLGVVAEPVPLLLDLAQIPRVVSSSRESWNSKIQQFIADFQAFTPRTVSDGVDFGEVIMALAQHAPANCTVTTDAGNMSTWVHRHWKMTTDNMLIGGIVGAMGLGVPAAVAASLVEPERMAICIVGDGGILMNGQEIATAVAYGAKPKIVLSDNGIYGTIRTHQEREYPRRISGTNLSNPDFTAWAKSFGIAAHRLAMGSNVDDVVKIFLAEPGASLLHVKSSAQSLSAFGMLKS